MGYSEEAKPGGPGSQSSLFQKGIFHSQMLEDRFAPVHLHEEKLDSGTSTSHSTKKLTQEA